MKISALRQWPAERLSHLVLYALLGMTVLLFGMFYLIGYDQPFEQNPQFIAPLLTDILLVFVVCLLLGTIGVGIGAVVKTVRFRKKDDGVVNRIPVGKIAYSIGGSTIVLLALTFLLGSSSPLIINGVSYSDTFWLKIADMFVSSAIVLILIGVVTIVYGYTRYYRKPGQRKS